MDIHLQSSEPVKRHGVIVFGAAKPSVCSASGLAILCHDGNLLDELQKL
jgi:hypothetical protein